MSDLPPLDETTRRSLAHDMRNALGALLNATELLEKKYEPVDREKRLFEVLRSELHRLRELVDTKVCPPRGR